MEPKSTPPNFEEVVPQDESAPLIALAQIIADWIKVHGVESLAKHKVSGNDGPSGEKHTPR